MFRTGISDKMAYTLLYSKFGSKNLLGRPRGVSRGLRQRPHSPTRLFPCPRDPPLWGIILITRAASVQLSRCAVACAPCYVDRDRTAGGVVVSDKTSPIRVTRLPPFPPPPSLWEPWMATHLTCGATWWSVQELTVCVYYNLVNERPLNFDLSFCC